MIKIIQGVYGHREGNAIVPKSVKDKPFSCDAKIEKRLVDSGVAIYVTEAEAEAAELVEDENEIKEPTREELIEMYKKAGLKGNPSIMSDKTLKAKIAEAAELVEDENEPVANADDGVVD